MFAHHPFGVGDRAVLGKGDQLGAPTKRDQFIEHVLRRAVVAVHGIVVLTDDVHVFVARIPIGEVGGSTRREDPDEVVESVLASEAVEHQAPKSLARLRAMPTPPEPPPVGLVERTPQHRHPRVLEEFQLGGNGVQVAQNRRVLLRAVGKRALQIKLGVLGIDRSFAERRSPMPAQRNDAMPVDIPINRVLRGRMTPPPPGRAFRAGNASQVQAQHRRQSAGGVGDVGQLEAQRIGPAPTLLLAGEDVLSVNVREVGHQRLNLRRRIWRHGCVNANRCRGGHKRQRQREQSHLEDA